MISPLLALFTRSVREDCRSKATYVVRGLLLVITLLFMLMMHLGVQTGAPGLDFFRVVLNLNCFFITVAGVSHFASAVTEEKEEMTLGLLRMTGLNPLSILLGKSGSRMIGAVLLLLVQFPFTLLAVSLGGVSISQVIAAYCTLTAYILLLGCVALFASVVCRRTSGATSMTLLFLVAFFFGPSLYRGLCETFYTVKWISTANPFPLVDDFADGVKEASPFAALSGILQTGFSGSAISFQFLSNIATAAIFFVLAWLVFNRFTRNETDPAPPRGLVSRRNGMLRWFSAGRTWNSALFWKDFYFMAGGKMGMLIKFLLMGMVALFVAYQMVFEATADRWPAFGGVLIFLSSAFLTLDLAVAAARIFRAELQWQTLSSVAILPMTTRSFIYHKAAAHLLAATPGIFFLFVGILLFSTSRYLHIDFDGLSGIMVAVMEAIFFIHLTAYLSLFLKRGALPIAFVISFVGNMATAMFFGTIMRGGGGRDAVTVVAWMSIFGLLFLTAVLHICIISRLQVVAAGE